MARFFLIFKDQDEIKANIKNARKGQSPAILTMKNKLGQEKIYYMAKKKIFSCRTNTGNPKRAKCALVANPNTGFASPCQLVEPAI